MVHSLAERDQEPHYRMFRPKGFIGLRGYLVKKRGTAQTRQKYCRQRCKGKVPGLGWWDGNRGIYKQECVHACHLAELRKGVPILQASVIVLLLLLIDFHTYSRLSRYDPACDEILSQGALGKRVSNQH